MLNPQGFVSECTGENIFVVRNGKLITPPLAAGALEGITQDSVMTIARDLGFDVRGRQPRPQRPLHRRRDVRVRHGRRGRAGQLGRRPRRARAPGPITEADHGRVRARPSAARSTATRTGSNMSERASSPSARAPSRSSTRPCATAASSRASRSPSTTSCASPSSSTTSACTTSRAAGRAPTPRTTSSSGGPRTELQLDTSTLVAFGSTRRPKGKVDDDADPAQPRRGRHVARCASSASRWDYHVTEALQTTLDEGVAMVADSVEFLAGDGPAGPARRRALLRRLQAQPRVLPARARGRGGARAPATSCCATPTAARCPTRSRTIVGEVVAHFGDDVIVGVHLHDDTGCGVANALAARAGRRPPGAGHDQRLRRAHRQLQPHDDHPEPHAEDGRRARCPRAASSGSRR